MKRIVFLVFIIFNIAAMAANGVIEKVRFNNKPMQMVFDINGVDKVKYFTEFSKDTRLLFIEISGVKLGKDIPKDYNIKNGYIEKVEMVEFNGVVNCFITLNKLTSFQTSVRNDPTRFVIDFSRKNKVKPVVTIDAGHGGQDGGASYYGLNEKDIVLSIAKLLKKRLESDYTVILTRSDDKFISLGERPAISNKNKADLLVSIHANASKNRKATGAEVFYFSKNPSQYAAAIAAYENSVDEKFGIKESQTEFIINDVTYKLNQELSAQLSEEMVKELSRSTNFMNRGIHGANFAVLRGSASPSVLVEVGFLSNRKEARKLMNKRYQHKIATALEKSIRKYFRKNSSN